MKNLLFLLVLIPTASFAAEEKSELDIKGILQGLMPIYEDLHQNP